MTAAADAALVWRVSDGIVDGVEVTGLGVALLASTLSAIERSPIRLDIDGHNARLSIGTSVDG